MQQLTPDQLVSLRSSIGPLHRSIEQIYSVRRPRQLLGEDGILLRTLGDDFEGPDHFKATYFDGRRGAEVKTEFAETLEALAYFDSKPSIEHRVELLLEVGDLLYQRLVVELRHKDEPKYHEVIEMLETALSYLGAELGRRHLSIDTAEGLAERKYGVRAWLGAHGFESKDPEREWQLCLEWIEKTSKQKG